MVKKIVSSLLSVLLVFSVLPVSVFASGATKIKTSEVAYSNPYVFNIKDRNDDLYKSTYFFQQKSFTKV